MTFSVSSSGQISVRRHPFIGSFLVIVFVVVLAAFAAYQSRLNHEQQARISANNLSHVLGNHVTSSIEKIDLSLSTIAMEVLQQGDRKGGFDSGNLNRLLAQQSLLLVDVDNVMAVDSAGVLKFGPKEITSLGINVSDREYFQRLRDNPQLGLVISGPYRSRVSNRSGMFFARRLSRKDGTFAGAVVTFVYAAHFERMLSSLNLGPKGMASLRTEDLTLIARLPKLESIGEPSDKAVSATYLAAVEAKPREVAFYATHPTDGIYRNVAYRKLNGFPLYIAVGLAQADYLAPWWQEVIQLAAMVTLFSLVVLWLSRNAVGASKREQATGRLLQEAVEHAAVGLSIFDSQQRLVICNGTVRGLFPEMHDVLQPGAKADYVVQTAVLRGAFPEAQDNPEQWISERLNFHQSANGQPFEQKLRDGRWLLVIENRTPSGYVISSRIDITELTKYGEKLEHLVAARTAELKAALDQSRILVELSPIALAMFDKDLKYLAHSRRWVELDGRGDHPLVGRPLHEANPDIPERWKAVHQEALAGMINSQEEDLWVRADGAECWVRWVCHPWIDAANQVGGFILSVDDITDRKRAEERLLKSEARFRSLFEQAAVGLAYLSLDGEFQQVNDKLCAILGYERDALLMTTFQDITYPDDLETDLALLKRLLAGAIPSYSREKRYIRQDGAITWVNLTVALVRTAEGKPDYFVSVLEDIELRKNAECALSVERRARQAILERQVSERTAELQAANQQLEGFVYASSHDLKGPLGRISSFSTLLEKRYRDRLEGDGLLFLDFIRDNALRLSKLVDDLLTHARVDQMVADRQPIDLPSAVQLALLEKREDLVASGAVARVSVPSVEVLADPYGLSQVLHNLLENALKYSTKNANPSIEIGGETVEGERFRLWIRDNGIGFDMEYHDNIFEMFRRLHTHAEYAGTGVGLALVKRAMERMGGRVWAESEPGKGAIFYMEFSTSSRLLNVSLNVG